MYLCRKIVIMIQRIQSLYLFIASLMMSMLFLFPIADFWGDISYQFSAFSFGDISADPTSPFSTGFTTPTGVFVILLVILPLLSILMFKARRKQLVLVRVILALLIAFLILVFFYYIPTIEKEIALQADYVSAKGMFFPIAAIVFLVLAQRGILKDEKLIRSMDRIR